MGHFEKDDLFDIIRHEMRLEDEDGPGLCSHLLQNATRRAKHGGLPLDFRKNSEYDDHADNCYDDVYEIPLYEEPLHTRTIINEHLAERTEEKIKEEKRVEGIIHKADELSKEITQKMIDDFTDNIYKGRLEDLFVRREVVWPPNIDYSKKSDIDRYLEENSGRLNNPLDDYSQFGATFDQPSKDVLIIYPKSAETTFEEPFRTIQISVTCTARVRDVVGYCMLQYFLKFEENLLGEVDDYQLFLAEEDGEIETDFPPLDSAKQIGQLGFDCLGLISRRRAKGGRNSKKVAVVYFLDKDHYAIEVENMEKPLRWLKDEALRLREEHVVEEPIDGLLRINEYFMEAADQFDVKLDMEASIASTRSLEFVMIRKNSSRAGFHPRGARYGRQMSAMLTLKMPNSPIPAAPSTPLPTVLESDETKQFALSSPTVAWSDGGGQLSCFTVMRVHRFKPKWKAKLIIRWTCFEIDKYLDRTAFLPQGYQKQTIVSWEYVGGIRVLKKQEKPGRIDTWQITFFWLPILNDEIIQRVVGDAEVNLRHVAQLYEQEEKWRNVTVESSKKTDVDEIASQMSSILHARDSSIYKAFVHSSFGVRSPAQSADLALMDCAEGPIMSPTDSNTSNNPKNNGKIRKMSRILLTPLANAMRKKSND